MGGGRCKRGKTETLSERILMAKNGLDKWFAQKWVDIEVKRKMFFLKMWKIKKRKMQNVSIQNASHLQSKTYVRGTRRSAVKRKRAVAQGVGGKPTNVKTFAKRKKAMGGGFMARRSMYV